MIGKCWEVGSWYTSTPKEITIIKETEKTFTTESKDWRGRTHENRHMKASTNIFATWEEAKAFVIERTMQKLEGAKREVDWIRSQLEEAKELKMPNDDAEAQP